MFRARKKSTAAKMVSERTQPVLGDRDVGASLQVRDLPFAQTQRSSCPATWADVAVDVLQCDIAVGTIDVCVDAMRGSANAWLRPRR